MTNTDIKFTDGNAYERYMGAWSQLIADQFLGWLKPATGLQWLDVGCGNGAFTQVIVDRCAPKTVDGVDPSEAQLVFARQRPASRVAKFQAGDAMALPFPDHSFDVAVMPLVIFFVPDPFKGVAEMARVVRPGGLVTAYGWDLTAGGFPYHIVQDEMEALGIPRRLATIPDAAEFPRLRAFWTAARLQDIETKVINVQRMYASADELWRITYGSPNIGPMLEAMRPDQIAELKVRVAQRVPADSAGRLTLTGRAHAIRGRVPAR